MNAIRVVFFDLGCTVWNEERSWTEWAQWLEVSPLALFAALGSAIERGEHHHRAMEIVRPGINVAEESRKRKAAGQDDALHPEDLYPDAIPCWEALRAEGYRIGVAGNHALRYVEALREKYPMLDFVGSSQSWGFEKPAARFFRRMIELSGVAPAEVAYVGDRLDNDVLPAKAAGTCSVFLRRGPWGVIHALRPEAAQAHIKIESLLELTDALRDVAL